jgi:hypothetical protein
MIVRRLVPLAMVVASLVLFQPGRASADCHWIQTERMVDGAIQLTTQLSCDESVAGAGEDNDTTAAVGPAAVRDSDWDAVCVRTALAVGVEPARLCDLPPDRDVSAPAVAAAPVLTPGLVARAFRRIELPASELQIQPPKGRTLVNFATNFYTERPAFDRTVTLLGRRVDLRIWPSQFRWVFGDGGELASTSAGAPYPDLLITHDYLKKGGVSPRVDTTYSARFRVDGGPWRDVEGTVTIRGNPVPLEVITARPVLLGSE